MTTVTLCGNPSCSGCPVLERKGDVVTIVDDFGGKVKMTFKQYKYLQKTVV